MHTETSHPEREIHTTRLLRVRPDQVFNAWADPVRLARWWGPKGFRNTFAEFDFSPGGHWRFVMHGPDGTDYQNHWIYRRVDHDRLVLDHVDVPKFRLTATLAEEAGGTRLTWVALFETAGECERVRKYAAPANEENFDRLEAELAWAL